MPHNCGNITYENFRRFNIKTGMCPYNFCFFYILNMKKKRAVTLMLFNNIFNIPYFWNLDGFFYKFNNFIDNQYQQPIYPYSPFHIFKR